MSGRCGSVKTRKLTQNDSLRRFCRRGRGGWYIGCCRQLWRNYEGTMKTGTGGVFKQDEGDTKKYEGDMVVHDFRVRKTNGFSCFLFNFFDFFFNVEGSNFLFSQCFSMIFSQKRRNASNLSFPCVFNMWKPRESVDCYPFFRIKSKITIWKNWKKTKFFLKKI